MQACIYRRAVCGPSRKRGIKMAQVAVSGAIPTWTLGDRLRKARIQAGLSQSELADDLGISQRSISVYEADEHPPKRPVLVSWALRCGVDLSWLEGPKRLERDLTNPCLLVATVRDILLETA